MNSLLETSIQRINTLDTRLVHPAMRVFDKCHKNKIPIYIVWGKRTYEQQDLMYRHGRSIPSPILTTNRAGRSAHNYGLALDFCMTFGNELMSWEEVYPRWYWRQKWLKAVKYFEEEGWTAGWRWPNFEPGHVENLLGNDITNSYEQDDIRNNRLKNI